jgi:plasmid stabilization system protein ParE
MAWKLYISDQASREIDEIWEYGYDKFGKQVADDYEALIYQALSDLQKDPYQEGTKLVRGVAEKIYSYHLHYSNKSAGKNIKSPRHAIFYFTIDEQVIAIASISREIRERHITSLRRDTVVRELKKKDQEET